MTNLRTNNDRENEKIDQAWARMQAKLAGEPVNPKWAEWGKHTENMQQAVEAVIAEEKKVSTTEIETNTTDTGNLEMITPARRRRMTRRGKWAATAAGLAALAIILATPVGNTAMAAILNQFRMGSVTAVNTEDIQNLFSQISSNGNVGEVINDIGTFKNTAGSVNGEMTPVQIHDTLGIVPLSAALSGNDNKLSVSPSQEIVMSFNVEKVNGILKRLGAKDLLPESVDGKPITLQLPESVYYDLSKDENHWASLQQMKTPVVSVDPSIKIEEALQAVIDFPLLPDNLKSSLKQSEILAGELPLPVFVQGKGEQIEVGGVKVMLDNSRDSSSYSAVWVKDGQLFNFYGGNIYDTREKVIAEVQELIGS